MSGHIATHIKTVIFDHDDTLVGTIGPKWDQHKYIARQHYGKELTDAEIIEHWGKPLRDMVGVLYETDDLDQAMAHNVAHHEKFPKHTFAATVPALRRIKKTGRTIGLVTATTRFSFEHDLALQKIPQDLFDYTQTCDDSPFHKPDPRVFDPALAWLAKHNIQPNEVLYIGDSLKDMKAALGAGFSFLGVETGLIAAEQFKTAGALSVPTVGHIVI